MPLTMFLYLFTFLDKYAPFSIRDLIFRMTSKDSNQVGQATGTVNGSQKDFYIIEALYYAGYTSLQSCIN